MSLARPSALIKMARRIASKSKLFCYISLILLFFVIGYYTQHSTEDTHIDQLDEGQENVADRNRNVTNLSERNDNTGPNLFSLFITCVQYNKGIIIVVICLIGLFYICVYFLSRKEKKKDDKLLP